MADNSPSSNRSAIRRTALIAAAFAVGSYVMFFVLMLSEK